MEGMAANVKVERLEEGSPAATEEAMDVGEAKFEENIWYKKYQLLKRKCSEFEQLNDILFTRAKKIHLMIEKAEAEKRSLMKRLEQFEVVEFPKTRQSSHISLQGRIPDDLSEFDHTLPFTAARVRAELEATKAAAVSSSSLSAAVNSMSPDVRGAPPSSSITVAIPPPPPLLGPFPHESQGSSQPSPAGTTSLHRPSTSVTVVPTVSAVPVAMTTTSVTPLSSVSGNAPVGGRGKKQTKRDGSTTHKGSSKKRKGDVDPNAPKKPSNAFFWFCQDKRAALQEQVKLEGLGGQHDLTKALARLWSETKTEDKKMYYEKYATDKARYDREMEDYQRSKQNLGGGGAATAQVAGGGGGGRGQLSSTPAAPAPALATAAVSSGLPRVVEPRALTTAVQQTVPSLLLQAGEEPVPES